MKVAIGRTIRSSSVAAQLSYAFALLLVLAVLVFASGTLLTPASTVAQAVRPAVPTSSRANYRLPSEPVDYNDPKLYRVVWRVAERSDGNLLPLLASASALRSKSICNRKAARYIVPRRNLQQIAGLPPDRAISNVQPRHRDDGAVSLCQLCGCYCQVHR